MIALESIPGWAAINAKIAGDFAAMSENDKKVLTGWTNYMTN